MNDEISFEYLMDDYTLPAQVVPIAGWATEDLVLLSRQIDAELQRRNVEAA